MNNNIKETTSLVFVKGKNLLNKDSGFENTYISSTGIITPGNNNALFEQIIRVLPNTSYTISCKQIIHNLAFSIYDENNNFITRRFENGVSSMTQTMPQNAAYMKVQFNYDNSTTITQSIIDTLNIMLVQGSTSVPYEPYVEKQIHIKNKNGVFEEFYNEEKKPNYIKNKLVSGTPDNNGFLNSGLNSNNVILGVSNISDNSGFFIPFVEKNANRLTLKCETWDRYPITTPISLMVHYIEI